MDIVLKDKSLHYLDCFCSGWNNHSCGASRGCVVGIQGENNKHWESTNRKDMCNDGMVDGWEAREKIEGR